MEKRKLKALPAPQLSRKGEERFVLCDEATGEIIDDAGGYGYRSAAGAHRAYSYKHRDQSRDERKMEEERLVQDWMKANPDLVRTISMKRLEMIRTGRAEQFNARKLKAYLRQQGFVKLPFSTSSLLRQWRRL